MSDDESPRAAALYAPSTRLPAAYTPPAEAPPAPNADGAAPGDEVVRLGTLTGLLRRRWPSLALGALTAVGAAAAYLWWAPPVYEADALLRVDAKQATLPAVYTTSNDVNRAASEAEVLRSRAIASAAASDAAMRLRVAKPHGLPRSALFSSVRVSDAADTGRLVISHASDGTVALDDLRPGGARVVLTPGRTTSVRGIVLTPAATIGSVASAELTISSPGSAADRLLDEVQVARTGLESNVIGLRYRDPDPALAQQVLQAWIDEYLARRQAGQHAEVHSTALVLRQQIDTLTRELATAEDAFRGYRERARVVDPQAEANTQITRYATLQAERNAVEAERVALARLVGDVRAQAAAQAAAPVGDTTVAPSSPYRRLLGFPTILRNSSSAQLLSALTQAEAARADLLVRRKPNDPDIAQLTQRVRDVETQIGDLAGTYLQGLTNQVAAADQSLSRFATQLDRAPQQQVEYARLERQPAVLAQLVTTLQTRLKEAQVAEAVADPTVQVVDPVYVSEKPVAPKRSLVLALGLFVGTLLGGGVAVLREQRDRAVRSRTDVARAVAAPVLGVIPEFVAPTGKAAALPPDAAVQRRALGAPRGRPQAIATAATVRGLAEDAYARLQLSLAPARPGVPEAAQGPRVLLVTSAMPQDGKSTTALNLALTSARRGARTLLVDADLRRGTLATVLGVQAPVGLAQMLAVGAMSDDAVVTCQAEPGVSLDLLAAGGTFRDAGRRLASGSLGDLVAVWRTEYDAVVIDSPPLSAVSDAAVLARFCDGVLLVAREGATPVDALVRAADDLRRVGAPVVGAVLNDAPVERDRAYAASYEYYGVGA